MKNLRNLPLSVIDFVYYTEKMSLDELYSFALALGTRLKNEVNTSSSNLKPIILEVYHLIHFLKQICWNINTNVYPGAIKDEDKKWFEEIMSRYA